MKRLILLVTAALISLLVSISSCNRDKEQQPTPVINSFSPTSGLPTTDDAPGTTITISGENFSPTISENKLQFNSVPSTIVSATKNELVTTVPSGSTTGKLTIIINDKSGISTDQFMVIPYPAIAAFAPATGPAGRTITITGSNFDSNAAGNIVKFNNITSAITSATTTQLVTTVPTGAVTGKISVTVNGATARSNSDFVVLPSTVITSFTPISGVAGTSVTITGSNFVPTPLLNIVKFGKVVATVASASVTQLVVTVPQGVATGKIYATVNDVTVASETNFVVPNSPVISHFSPLQGVAGTIVTIEGSNFSSVIGNNPVKFNGTEAVVSSASATQLVATVPTNVTSGRISVTTVNGLTAYSENRYCHGAEQ